MPTTTNGVDSSIMASRLRPTITATMPPTRYRFQRPVRVMMRPVTMLEITSPATIAMDIRPAWVGLIPRASWKYWLR